MNWDVYFKRPENVDEWDPGIPNFKNMTEDELKEYDETFGKQAKEFLERLEKEKEKATRNKV